MVAEGTTRTNPLSASVMTDDDGNFQFTGLAAGHGYFVGVKKAGLGPAYFNGSRRLRPSTRFQCRAGENTTGYLIQVAALGIIHGQIRDDDGELLAGAQVEVFIRTTSGYLRKINGGSSGTLGGFTMTVAPGKYYFRAKPAKLPDSSATPTSRQSNEEGDLVPTYYPGATRADAASPVVVGAGEDVNVAFQIQRIPASKLSGKVLGWKPGYSGTATLREVGADTIFNETIDAKTGNFTIAGVYPGKYELRVEASFNSPSDDEQASVDDSEFAGHTVVDVNAPNITVSVALSPVPPDREYEGKIVTVSKPPAPLDSLKVETLAPGDVADMSVIIRVPQLPVEADGTFRLEVKGGQKVYIGTVSTTDAWRDWYVKAILLDERDITETGLSSTDSGKSLRIVMSAEGGVVQGVAVDGDSKPVADAYVILFPEGKLGRYDMYEYTKADAKGAFTIRGVRPIEYAIVAWEADPPRDALRDPAYIVRAAQGAKRLTVKPGVVETVTVTAQDPEPEN